MRCDNGLGVIGVVEVVEHTEEGEQDVDAGLEPIREQRHERLAVRLAMQRASTVCTQRRADLLDVRREIVEALRAMLIAVPAFGVEPAALGQRFEQRGLATAILADEERDSRPQRQVDPIRERRDREWEGCVVDAFGNSLNLLEEGCGGARNRAPSPGIHPPTMPGR